MQLLSCSREKYFFLIKAWNDNASSTGTRSSRRPCNALGGLTRCYMKIKFFRQFIPCFYSIARSGSRTWQNFLNMQSMLLFISPLKKSRSYFCCLKLGPVCKTKSTDMRSREVFKDSSTEWAPKLSGTTLTTVPFMTFPKLGIKIPSFSSFEDRLTAALELSEIQIALCLLPYKEWLN